MPQVLIVQHYNDYESTFEVFASKAAAIVFARKWAEENASERKQLLHDFWYEVCDIEEGHYVTNGGDLWIQVHEDIPFTPATP